jgi:hypothetical protein
LLAGFRKFNRFKGRIVAKKKVAAAKKVAKKPGPVAKIVKAVVETIKHPVVAVENVLGEKGQARRTKRRAAIKSAAVKVGLIAPRPAPAAAKPAKRAALKKAPAKKAVAAKPAKKAAKK